MLDTPNARTAIIYFLKATVKKQVWIPQFTKKNGQVVGGHFAMVHVSDDHDHAKVAGGAGSHSQKMAHAALKDEPGYAALGAEDQAALVMHHATHIQDAQSAAARLATLRKKLLAGEKPTPGEWKHFHAAPADKQQAITEAVHAAGHGAAMDAQYADWAAKQPPANVAPADAAPPVPAGKAPEEKPTADLPPDPKPAPQADAAGKNPPAAAAHKPAELAMPDFQEGKDAVGVKAHYEKTGQKIIDAANAGDIAALEAMPNPDKGQSWKGKTANSKALLAMHAAALVHAKGDKPAAPDAAPAAAAEPAARADKFAEAKADPHKELAVQLSAAGFSVMVGSKGVLLASSPDFPKTYANQTQASNAAAKLVDAGFDASVIGMHPYLVKVHGKMAGAPAADNGPKEGDTKEGEGGTLVLKDGHWVLQASAPAAPDPEPDADPAHDAQVAAANAEPDDAQALLKLKAAISGAKVPSENTNAKAFNPKVDAIITALHAGDKDALLAMSYGTNTYGKKAAKLANEALSFLGSRHLVAPGQKAGTHAKLKVVSAKVTPPAAAAPAPAPAAPEAAPAVEKPAAAAPAPKAEPVPPSTEGMSPSKVQLVGDVTHAFHSGNVAKLEILEASTANFASFAPINQYIKDAIDHLKSGDKAGALAAGWSAAITSGKVPSKAQAEAMDALKESNADEYFDIESEAQVELAAHLDLDLSSDETPELAQFKLKQLHDHALAGTTPAALGAGLSNDEIKAAGTDPGTVMGGIAKHLAKEGDIDGLKKLKTEAWDAEKSEDFHFMNGLVNKLAAKQKEAPAAAPKPASAPAAAIGLTAAEIPAANSFAAKDVVAVMNKLAMDGDLDGLKGATQDAFDQGKSATTKHGNDLIGKLTAKQAGAPAMTGNPALDDPAADGEAGAAAEQGPKDGDTKQGADGMLEFKDGRWHKVGTDPAVLKKKAASVPIPKMTGKNSIKFGKSIKMLKQAAEQLGADGLAKIAKVNEAAGTIKVTGYVALSYVSQEGYGANALAMAKYAKALHDAMAGTKGPGAAATPAAPAVAAPKASSKPGPGGIKTLMVSRILSGGIANADNWQKTGDQLGSNNGGFYKDSEGQQWYVKTLESDDHVKNELLANKLYAALGIKVPEVKQVKMGGKLSIASKVVDGLKKDPAALKTSDDMLMGFGADAWLANWDVVGLGHDNAMVDKSGSVYRIDPGGALMYRAQGGEKGAAFGNSVTELDTLRDAVKNPQSAAIFGAMTPAQLDESVKQVLLLKDSAIHKLCMAYGPGDKAAREALSAKLIARKADLAAKFPNAAAEAAPKKTVQISPAPNFKEWKGPGVGLSSYAHLNQQNQDLADQMQKLAAEGKLGELENMKFQPIAKETGAAEGDMQPIVQHKSKHIPLYWQDLIQAVKNPVRSLEHMKDAVLETVGGVFGTLASVFDDVKGLKDAAAKIGRYALIGKVDGDPFESWNIKELSQKNGAINAKELYDQSHAAYNKLSNIEKQAIQQYTGSGYSTMNNAATGVGSHSNTDYALAGFDKASVPLKAGTVLSRKFSFGSDADLQKFLEAEGGIVKDFGMISTSLNPSVWSGNVHLRIVCGEGVKGCYVAPNPDGGGKAISQHPGEQEVVLPYGTKFFVRKVSKKGHSVSDAHGSWGTGGYVIEVVALPNS